MDTPKPHARLTFPAPRRCAVNCGVHHLPKGHTATTWIDQPWTLEQVERAKEAGAYFMRGRHDFVDKDAEVAALGIVPKAMGSVRHWLKQLSPIQRELLKEILSKETS